jgi:lipooligosaccharide transport system permease protein
MNRMLPMVRVPRSERLIERNIVAYWRTWIVLFSGFFEPLFYLLSIGVGIGELVGEVEGPNGELVAYRDFVAPGMLAASAMNGAVLDSTYNVFYKLKYAKTYDAVLATPLSVANVAYGEIGWAVMRGTIYSGSFLVVMAALGLIHSWWAILALPAALLIALAFAAVGMIGTSMMRTWQDFMWINLIVLPLFLFSTTFYPLDVYSSGVQAVVKLTPLYHGVVLIRALTLGAVQADLLVNVAYLAVMAAVGVFFGVRRMERLLVT